MSSGPHFPEPEEAHELLQDILAFIDSCDDHTAPSSTDSSAPLSCVQRVSTANKDSAKRKRAKDYSPDYERRRREKKKAEREALKMQAQQYETQLELLRLRRPPVHQSESKWGWVEAATAEEEKRRKAEELNRQLRGLVAQHLSTAQTFKNLLTQDSGLAERAQVILDTSSMGIPATLLTTLSSLGDITAHLKVVIGQLYAASDFVFGSASMFKEDASSLGSLASAATLKYHDPLGGSCIELLSSTPLTCSFKTAVPMLWKMMVSKEVFGPDAAFYTMKTKRLTQSSAEMEYSLDFKVSDASVVFDGVTLMHKHEEENRAVLIWTSMLVQKGSPYSRTQGWVSVTKQPCNPKGEAVVRMCSHASGGYFGIPCNGSNVDVPVARKHQLLAKSRLERVQVKMLERAESQG